uniref:Uncharacterized protein n=1 Tax=Vespula pensylvanica TaxID=30213 RepID=A0A834K124_VESPE|nr:hypothetical protein H0235_016100 [Vespula pensylvanica]
MCTLNEYETRYGTKGETTRYNNATKEADTCSCSSNSSIVEQSSSSNGSSVVASSFPANESLERNTADVDIEREKISKPSVPCWNAKEDDLVGYDDDDDDDDEDDDEDDDDYNHYYYTTNTTTISSYRTTLTIVVRATSHLHSPMPIRGRRYEKPRCGAELYSQATYSLIQYTRNPTPILYPNPD